MRRLEGLSGLLGLSDDVEDGGEEEEDEGRRRRGTANFFDGLDVESTCEC